MKSKYCWTLQREAPKGMRKVAQMITVLSWSSTALVVASTFLATVIPRGRFVYLRRR